MTETPPDPEPYAWLPSDRVLRWLGLTDGDEQVALAEDCRTAAADWCEDQRPDLFVVDPLDPEAPPTFTATDKIVQAGVIATARLYARKGSTAGLASYAELGVGDVLALDPDVARLLGTGVYARPAVG